MSAETLRRAADEIRADYPDPTTEGDYAGEALRVVADWLDDVADGCDQNGPCAEWAANRFARAYLGETP